MYYELHKLYTESRKINGAKQAIHNFEDLRRVSINLGMEIPALHLQQGFVMKEWLQKIHQDEYAFAQAMMVKVREGDNRYLRPLIEFRSRLRKAGQNGELLEAIQNTIKEYKVEEDVKIEIISQEEENKRDNRQVIELGNIEHEWTQGWKSEQRVEDSLQDIVFS